MTEGEHCREPIFVVGAERSGTTMLRLMLDHHPEIAFLGEFEFAVECVEDGGRLPDIRSYREFLLTNRIFLDSGLRVDPSLDFPGLVRSFLEQKRERDKKPQVGATVHRSFNRLAYIWPRARYIHILRDPRDVALSTIAMGWAGNVWCGARRWIDAEETWSRLEATLSPERWTLVRYESLVQDPVSQLKQLCDFLSVPYDARMLEYRSSTSYAAPDPKIANRWKRTLTEREVRLVEQKVGSLLAARGYEPSGLPTIEVPPQLERQLRRQDRIARIRFRIKRYGLALFVAEYLSRMLGSRALHARVMARVHAVTRRHLR